MNTSGTAHRPPPFSIWDIDYKIVRAIALLGLAAAGVGMWIAAAGTPLSLWQLGVRVAATIMLIAAAAAVTTFSSLLEVAIYTSLALTAAICVTAAFAPHAAVHPAYCDGFPC